MILGFRRKVSYFKYGKHAFFSSSFGSRLLGGMAFYNIGNIDLFSGQPAVLKKFV